MQYKRRETQRASTRFTPADVWKTRTRSKENNRQTRKKRKKSCMHTGSTLTVLAEEGFVSSSSPASNLFVTLTGTNFRGDSFMFLSSALHFTAPSTCAAILSRVCSFVLHFSYSVTFSNLSFSFFSASSCREHKDSVQREREERGKSQSD